MTGWSPRASIEKRLTISSGDVILVRDPAGDALRNVFLVDHRGQVLWQIEAASQLPDHAAYGYSAVYLGPDDALLAYSSNGVEYRIDAASGKVLEKELIR